MSCRTLCSSAVIVLLLLSPCSSSPAISQPPVAAPSGLGPAGVYCPALPAPVGNTVNVSTVSGLVSAVNGASAGDTILVADGTYAFGSGDYLRITAPNVAIRSASGFRDAVVIDGNYQATELIQVVASNAIIADLTLRKAYYHPIHVMTQSGSDTLNTLIYNVHIVDPGQQAIKINPAAAGYYPDDGTIACSHIELSDAGRTQVWNINGSCYTGGVDAHQAQGWTVRDNVIEGFWCPGDGGGCEGSDLSEHAIHLWRGCRDTVVERNVLRDNARGVGFGLGADGNARVYPDHPCPSGTPGDVEHYDGVIRNNFVSASRGELFASDCGFDCGICLWNACGAQALHNTVYATSAPFSSIEWRFSSTVVDIRNNLVNYPMMARDGASATLAGNVPNAQASWFVDGAGGDLHLLPAATLAIDQGVALAGAPCVDDIDGDVRPYGSERDVGADEFSPPAAITDLRVTNVVTGTGQVTVTLGWTAPANALTTTLRYDWWPIAEGTWVSSMPLTDTLPGGSETYTATVYFEGGSLFFALKTENDAGVSALSNNAFWPRYDVFLPVTLRDYP